MKLKFRNEVHWNLLAEPMKLRYYKHSAVMSVSWIDPV